MKKDKDIFCSECGMRNSEKNKKCSACFSKLNRKDNLLKDYMMDHLQEKYIGKVNDSTWKLIKAYVGSHLYGVTVVALIVFIIIALIVKCSFFKSEAKIRHNEVAIELGERL